MKKFTRLLAGALIASMMFSITACGKEGNFTAKKFKKVAVENLDAEEWDLSDINIEDQDDIEGYAADIMADLEDGIFATRTGEDIMDDDNYDEDIYNIIYGVLDIDLDMEKIDANSIYLRGSLEDEDEYYILSASLLEFKDKDAASTYFQSVLHNIKRGSKITNAVCGTEFDIETLEKETFKYNGKNSGHIVIKLSSEDIDAFDDLDIDEEMTVVFGFYIEGKDVFTVFSVCPDAEGNDETTEFFKLMGMKNPYELESTEAVVDFINDVYKNSDKIYKRWMDKFENSTVGQVVSQTRI